MKYFLTIILFATTINLFSQYKYPYYFGDIKNKELTMTIYNKDTTANAVVLYEHGNTEVKKNSGIIFLKTTIYKKIKILKKEGEENATVKIYLYNKKNKSGEKVKNITAFTYNNGEAKMPLTKNNIFTTKLNDTYKEVTFTFPNVKVGSVLEYRYDLESEFFFNFEGWKFQSEIPKIYSEYHAIIPGYWQYNRTLKGSQKLLINEAKLKQRCFEISGSTASCEELTYAMQDIPALIEEEDFSTTKDNYISTIKFELSKISYPDGRIEEFTTTWKDTDRQFKIDESIGKQLNNKSFFTNNIPPEILNIEGSIPRAKAVYSFVQNHFSLNENKKYIYKDVNVKKAYKENIGSVSEINTALVNALKAAGIESNLMFISTRDNGFPTKLHPVMTDFNYVVAYAYINKLNYTLDASDKNLQFGMLPYKALNGYGRVLDFDNGSFWLDIVPKVKTYNRTVAKLKLTDENNLSGTLSETNNGYFAKYKRDRIKNNTEEDYLSYKEDKIENIEIDSYKNNNLENFEKPLLESSEVTVLSTEEVGNKLYINPFIDKYDKNPFNLNQRYYPVDFGFNFIETYIANIEIPNTYKIKSLPESISLKLPDKGGSFVAKCDEKDNKITLISKISIHKSVYSTEEYQYLKELFNQIIKNQKTLIVLEKTELK
ncbi:MAG: DUF3857 domain-containing protein [Bacteroidota bacterium]